VFATSCGARANADVPPLSAEARSAGFVDVRSVVPSALIDLRYATPNNFTGMPLYPADARCLAHESMAPGLAAAEKVLSRQGQVLVFWDCYRPHDVQVKMFNVVAESRVGGQAGFLCAQPRGGAFGRRGRWRTRNSNAHPARQLGGRCLADMGTDFDDFSPRALAFATDGVSADQQANRARLRDAMSAGGLSVYSGEWWHFDGPGAGVQRPILNVPID